MSKEPIIYTQGQCSQCEEFKPVREVEGDGMCADCAQLYESETE